MPNNASSNRSASRPTVNVFINLDKRPGDDSQPNNTVKASSMTHQHPPPKWDYKLERPECYCTQKKPCTHQYIYDAFRARRWAFEMMRVDPQILKFYGMGTRGLPRVKEEVEVDKGTARSRLDRPLEEIESNYDKGKALVPLYEQDDMQEGVEVDKGKGRAMLDRPLEEIESNYEKEKAPVPWYKQDDIPTMKFEPPRREGETLEARNARAKEATYSVTVKWDAKSNIESYHAESDDPKIPLPALLQLEDGKAEGQESDKLEHASASGDALAGSSSGVTQKAPGDRPFLQDLQQHASSISVNGVEVKEANADQVTEFLQDVRPLSPELIAWMLEETCWRTVQKESDHRINLMWQFRSEAKRERDGKVWQSSRKATWDKNVGEELKAHVSGWLKSEEQLLAEREAVREYLGSGALINPHNMEAPVCFPPNHQILEQARFKELIRPWDQAFFEDVRPQHMASRRGMAVLNLDIEPEKTVERKQPTVSEAQANARTVEDFCFGGPVDWTHKRRFGRG